MTKGSSAPPATAAPRRCSEERSSSLEISTLVVGDTAVARLTGDLDHLTASQLRTWAEPVFDADARNLVIDCTDLSFLDSAGLEVLLELARDAHHNSGTLAIRHCTPAIYRIFELAGLHHQLSVEPIELP